ncbi:MAG: hypothetical protein WD382_07425 [Halofilum sp. (in: g-proteobacteria)]
MTVVLAVSAMLAMPSAEALSFYPGRIVLDDEERSAVLRIINRDDVPRRYIVSWHRMRMTPERGLRPVPEDDPASELKPAREHVLFGPRQAVVPPNSVQAVRFMAQVPADLPPGEYRSHLMITEPPRETDLDPSKGDSDAGGVRMEIKMVNRTTMPVILRHGNPQSQVSLEDAQVRPAAERPRLDVNLGRSGASSAYLDATVTWEAPGGERFRVFGPATLAIYPEIDHREFSHRLSLPEGRTLNGGTLHYVLRNHPLRGGSGPVLVDRRIRVP